MSTRQRNISVREILIVLPFENHPDGREDRKSWNVRKSAMHNWERQERKKFKVIICHTKSSGQAWGACEWKEGRTEGPMERRKEEGREGGGTDGKKEEGAGSA